MDSRLSEGRRTPVIVVTRRLPPKVWNQLTLHGHLVGWEADQPVSREWLLDHISGADALYCLLTDRIDHEILALGKRLRVVSTMAVGTDHIDVEECTKRRIPVGHTPDVLTDTTADLAFALLMAAARRIVEGADYVRLGRWTTWDPELLLGQDVWRATLGIIGFGRIGRAVANRALGFQMKVLVVPSPRQGTRDKGNYHTEDSPEGDPDDHLETPFDRASIRYASLQEVLEKADFLSLHVPLTDETRHMIGKEELAAMKPTAMLINTARGGVVDTEALYRALMAGTIAGAGLDVTDPEPLPASHPLLSLPNCLVIPHLGSASVATRTRMALMAAENVIAGLRGDRLPYCANPQVYAS